jgi:hypothetical protein
MAKSDVILSAEVMCWNRGRFVCADNSTVPNAGIACLHKMVDLSFSYPHVEISPHAVCNSLNDVMIAL